MDENEQLIAEHIVHSLASRDAAASVCPSEIARLIAPAQFVHWRVLMPRVRAVIATLARTERVRVTRGSMTLDPDNLTGGPIRIRRGPRFQEAG